MRRICRLWIRESRACVCMCAFVLYAIVSLSLIEWLAAKVMVVVSLWLYHELGGAADASTKIQDADSHSVILTHSISVLLMR